MHILILGGSGQLGLCLAEYCQNHSIPFTALDRSALDITLASQPHAVIQQIQPSAVINACAYTYVDEAETSSHAAFQVNQMGPHNLAKACEDLSIPLIHVSTDYVFDGLASSPYAPNHSTNPINEYGRSKLAGELEIQKHCKSYFIVRTSSVFSEHGKNFLKTILGLLSSQKQIKIISNQYIAPTYAKDLAEALVLIAIKAPAQTIPSQIYHYAGNMPCSWYDFAKAIMEEASNLHHSLTTELIPIPYDNFPQTASRPIYSPLDSSNILLDFGMEPSDWMNAIPKIIQTLEINADNLHE
jgi:dTDP-4-dehydrorhamnose reductase